MHQNVIIKGNPYGLSVYLDPELPFDALLEEAAEKFHASSRFFRGAKLALMFEGRKLESEEINRLVQMIGERSEIEISCVIDTDKKREDLFRKLTEDKEEPQQKEPHGDGSSRFCKGTLRSGQTLESDGDVILFGDVNPGARIVAKGNIIVMGALRGSAMAGICGKQQAVIAALEMDPIQLGIGETVVRVNGRIRRDQCAKIAYFSFGQIHIEPITREVIETVDFS